MGNDPLFGVPGPLLFAHRGGAKEAPESTLMAFDHAKAVRSDVLELDVSLTKDGEIVVWHGPDLRNVRLHHEKDDVEKRTRTDIREFKWAELREGTWVDDYRERYVDVSKVPTDPRRRILLLEEMLEHYPTDLINIEVKASFEPEHVADLVGIIGNAPGRERRILVVAASHGVVARLEKALAGSERFLLGFSALQVFGSVVKAALPFVSSGTKGRALQTSYFAPLCSRRLIRKVHANGGAVHAFITPFFFIPGLDEVENNLKREAILAVLERGVDGIMTDRPREVRPVLDEWKRERAR